MAESKTVVLAALVANGAIAVLKFVAFLLTQSPAMLSETYHSISDTGNQVFLLVGIRYGSREASRTHPFGYGKAQFFYSFLVSVLLFGIAGWESANEGYHALVGSETHVLSGSVTYFGQTFPAVWVSYAVLVGAIGFESWAFTKANKEMRRQIREHGWSGYREAFRKTSDVTTLTALTEDTIALAGLVLALVGIALSQWTGNPVFDAAAALGIGFMLMGFALALAWENKRLLIGESLSRDEERELLDVVEGFDAVADIVDFRTVYFGPERLVVTADVAFQRGLVTGEIDDYITDIEAALQGAHPHVKKVYVEPEVVDAEASEDAETVEDVDPDG